MDLNVARLHHGSNQQDKPGQANRVLIGDGLENMKRRECLSSLHGGFSI
jgi:hypothetical protein